MDVTQFIKEYLIIRIGKVIQCGEHYLAFSLMCQGFEFLGACLDEYDFFKPGQSENRFQRGIQLVPGNTYESISAVIFKDLRCGLLHVFLPKAKLELTQNSDVEKFGNHLSQRPNGRTVLVCEEFYADLERASNEVIKMIQDSRAGTCSLTPEVINKINKFSFSEGPLG